MDSREERGGMKTIYTKRNEPIIVDDSDYESLSEYVWHLNGSGYAQTNIKDKSVFMHRFLLGLSYKDGFQCDHINGIRTDNRRKNLRVCSFEENMRNKNVQKNNKLGVKGVHKTRHGNYITGVWKNKQYICFGVYDTIEQAIEARKIKGKQIHGEFFNSGVVNDV
jgi:hypothetical protein